MGDEDELAEIWSEHRSDLIDRAARLLSAVRRAVAGDLAGDERTLAVREAHTFAGTAAIFGRTTMAGLARRIEASLEAGGPRSPSEGREILVAAEELGRAVATRG